MKQRRHSPTTIAVLIAMLDQPADESYGYGLTARTGLVSGSLYPILARLERRGLVTGEWQLSHTGRPPKRIYRLTEDGLAEALRFKAVSDGDLVSNDK
jgi:DNA-binding PadR family transcriptional regulator